MWLWQSFCAGMRMRRESKSAGAGESAEMQSRKQGKKRGRKRRKRNKELNPVASFALFLLILVCLPLPAALVAGGFSWVESGIHSVPKEFIIAYGVEAAAWIVSVAAYCWKHRRGK